MELVNTMYKLREKGKVRAAIMREAAEKLILILSPFTPHVCEEMWEAFGNNYSILHRSWPGYDESALVRATEEIAVQVNGKLKGKIIVESGLTAEELADAAAGTDEIKALIKELSIIKIISVPGRLVNIVAK
jgi:leucyl-tRNA synthetase